MYLSPSGTDFVLDIFWMILSNWVPWNKVLVPFFHSKLFSFWNSHLVRTHKLRNLLNNPFCKEVPHGSQKWLGVGCLLCLHAGLTAMTFLYLLCSHACPMARRPEHSFACMLVLQPESSFAFFAQMLT